jgi:hypothetical protein
MMKKRVAANPDRVKKIGGMFQYNITKDGRTVATWSVYSTHFFLCFCITDACSILLLLISVLNCPY